MSPNTLPTPEILSGKVCPYCGSGTEYIDSKEIYGKTYGMMYVCRPCDAYVSVHSGTDISKGRLANKELRWARKEAHFYFDQIAKTSLINEIWVEFLKDTSNRNKAYKWLSKQMDMDEDLCHIGMFDVNQCRKVTEISKKYLRKFHK